MIGKRVPDFTAEATAGPFTLADLEAALESVRALDERLRDIRDRDPL